MENSNKTEFYNKVITLLKENGYDGICPSSIAILVENDCDYAFVEYNYMTTGIRFPKKEVSKEIVEDAGFKFWSTWNYVNFGEVTE